MTKLRHEGDGGMFTNEENEQAEEWFCIFRFRSCSSHLLCPPLLSIEKPNEKHVIIYEGTKFYNLVENRQLSVY